MRRENKAEIIHLLARICLIALLAYIFFGQVFLIARVHGMDMAPSLKDGDIAIVYRLQRDYQKDDIIAYETEEGTRFARVSAWEGDELFAEEDAIQMDSVSGKVITLLRRRNF